MADPGGGRSADHVDLTTAPSSGLRWLTGTALAFTAFMVLLAGGCLLALLTRPLTATGSLTAAVIGAMAALGTAYGVRSVGALRAVAHPEVLARLDREGLHLHEGLGVPDLPQEAAWTTVPWSWVSSVSHTTLDLRTVKRLGPEVPLEVLRFVLADDRLLDGGPGRHSGLGQVARMLGLTPSQTRTVLVGEAGATSYAAAMAWLGTHRPDLALLSGTTLPWSTRARPDAWPDSPRVAVVGAHGRLGRHVLEVLARREKAPPVALARNEAHRADLERLGAEVRMVDLEQGPAAVADALRGCAAVVHAAPGSVAVVVEAARRSAAARLLLVPEPREGDEALALAASSGLAWTAFRPTALTDEPATGEVVLGHDVASGPVPRADLAEVVVAAIRDEDSVGAAWPIAGAPASG